MLLLLILSSCMIEDQSREVEYRALGKGIIINIAIRDENGDMIYFDNIETPAMWTYQMTAYRNDEVYIMAQHNSFAPYYVGVVLIIDDIIVEDKFQAIPYAKVIISRILN